MNREPTIVVWDLPTRIFHWSLLALVALAFATSETEGFWFDLHLAAGYGVIALVVFRLAWGFVGTRYARFSEFVRPWAAVRAHAADVLRLSPSRYVGHNPLGGWMILGLLALLAVLAATGVFAGDDDAKGPLAHLVGAGVADALGELHEGLNAVLWTLVAIHVAGIAVESFLTRENLVRAMWTGTKDVAGAAAAGQPARWALAVSMTLAVVAVVGVAW